MLDIDLAVKLFSVAHAAVENGKMRHDVGLLLLDVVCQHHLTSVAKPVYVNVYATRLPEFEGYEAAAFDSLKDARENAALNAAETLAVGVPVDVAGYQTDPSARSNRKG